MDKLTKFGMSLAILCSVFAAGVLVGLNQRPNRGVPIHSHQLSLEFALGERVIVTDYSIDSKREKVEGVVVGWGLTDWELTGKEEIAYFVETPNVHSKEGHSAHGYKADEITRVSK